MRNTVVQKLEVGVSLHLFRVEVTPALSMKLPCERHNAPEIHEVNESIANIASILEVNWQVEKVVCFTVVSINL
jgi:hypothetical protein